MTGGARSEVKLAGSELQGNGMAPSDLKEAEIEWIDVLDDSEVAVRLPVSIEGMDVIATLDTGASITVVDSRFANRFGIKPVSTATVSGNVNAAQGAWGTPVTIKIGSAVVKLSKVLLLDLLGVSSPGGTPISLILGHDVFDRAVLDIDLINRRIAFRSAANFQQILGAEKLAIKRGLAGERYVLVSLEDHPVVPAILDLGSSNPIMISAHYANAEKLLSGKRVSSAAIGGVDGISITSTSSLASLTLGSNSLIDVPCEIFSNWYSPTIPANIGLPVLRRFRFAIDFTADVLWIVPQSAASTPPFQRDLSGLGLATGSDRLSVVHIALGSPAALDNWAIGDFITAVDGHSINPNYPNSPLSKWRYGPEGRTVELTLGKGLKRILTLRRYY